jgi:hypothetical protein
MRAAEAIKASPEKSDRAIAVEIGASPTTVGKAREQLSTTGQLEDTPRTGLDGKTRRTPVKQALPEEADDEADDEPSDLSKTDYVDLLVRANKLEDRVSDLTKALDAKEAVASRNWPADMTKKQIKKRDSCLASIAWWQGELERHYAEVTKQPPWRVELIANSGLRYGNGVRLATRGEAEAYGQTALRKEIEGEGIFEILPCENEKANMQIVGTSIHFDHGDCVLLNWHPIGAHNEPEIIQ